MNQIHSSVIISSKAKLGDRIIVHPYSIIEDDVEIGDDCEIGPYAVLYNGARIGNRVKIKQSASVANSPQDLGYNNEPTHFYIGDDTIIYEFVALHRGTKSTGMSKVGKNCFLMAYSHVAHDSVIGDNVILANGVQVAGHVHIEDFVTIGGLTPVHQFCTVGQHSMTGGGFRITQDLPPYILAAGYPLKFGGLNVIGLRRRGFSNEDIIALKKAYNFIYDKSLNVSQAKTKIENELTGNRFVKNVIDFINNSKRGLIGK